MRLVRILGLVGVAAFSNCDCGGRMEMPDGGLPVLVPSAIDPTVNLATHAVTAAAVGKRPSTPGTIGSSSAGKGCRREGGWSRWRGQEDSGEQGSVHHRAARRMRAPWRGSGLPARRRGNARRVHAERSEEEPDVVRARQCIGVKSCRFFVLPRHNAAAHVAVFTVTTDFSPWLLVRSP